jgi:flagellar biosynthesis protein FliR
VNELFPILLGALVGIPILFLASNRVRLLLSVAAVLIIGAASTVLSGEYVQSWIYLLLDFGEAALGLAAGFTSAYLWSRVRARGLSPSRLN